MGREDREMPEDAARALRPSLSGEDVYHMHKAVTVLSVSDIDSNA